MNVVCRDCGRKREPYRPICRRVDGHVEFVCRQCWRHYDYDAFMVAQMTDEDRIALRRAQRGIK